jgi:hypothetical protein
MHEQEGFILISVKMKRDPYNAKPRTDELLAALAKFPKLSPLPGKKTDSLFDVTTTYKVADQDELGVLLQEIRNLPCVVQCHLLNGFDAEGDVA